MIAYIRQRKPVETSAGNIVKNAVAVVKWPPGRCAQLYYIDNILVDDEGLEYNARTCVCV